MIASVGLLRISRTGAAPLELGRCEVVETETFAELYQSFKFDYQQVRAGCSAERHDAAS